MNTLRDPMRSVKAKRRRIMKARRGLAGEMAVRQQSGPVRGWSRRGRSRPPHRRFGGAGCFFPRTTTVPLAEMEPDGYISRMNWLTPAERKVLVLILSLLFVGWGVKVYRAAHPPPSAVQPVKL